jgi:CHAT domain-containing protein/Tfp pilus assembly protein PilF
VYQQVEDVYHRGDLPKAQSEAKAGYNQSLSSNPELAGKFRLLEIQSMLMRGMYTAAYAELSRSSPEIFATCELAARRSLLEASANYELGNAAEGRKSMEAAKHQCASPDPILSADIATREGVFEDAPAIAEKDFMTALSIARQQRDRYREAGALLNLGYATTQQERYDESVGWNRASLQLAKTNNFKLYEQMAVGSLAWSYYKLGDYDQALPLFVEAERQADLVDAGYERIRWRNNLGILHEETGDLITAEEDYRKALDLARQQGDQNQTTIALSELAFISIKTGQWAEAENYSNKALELARKDEDRPLELASLFAQGLIAEQRGDEKTAEKLLFDVARDPGHDRQSARWQAQTALAELYAKQGRAADAGAEYRVALQTVLEARCSIEHEDLRMPFLTNATRVYDSNIDFLVGQGKVAEALKSADESRALTLAEGLGIGGKKCLAAEATFDPQSVARRANATVLFYWLAPEHSYLWAINPTRIKLYQLPPSTEIEQTVQAYRKALVGPRDVLQSEDPNGKRLYQALVAPAAEFFHPNGRVIVIADGSLNGLNFETLIASEPHPHYWIEDVTLESASSLRLLAVGPAKGASGNGGLLLMGDSLPPSGEEYAALPKAAEEMQIVGRYFPSGDEQVFGRGYATAGAYLTSQPERFAYIHFVAHGTASLSDPLDSAVVLSPSSADGGYKLYARDVIAHPLRAELVTVSACKGAGARAYAGEGLVGLSWAFLRAGAHHVIGALWDVSDSATPQLMDAMYAELVQGSTPDLALREAKLSLLHSEGVYRKPIYWAAFQLYTGS